MIELRQEVKKDEAFIESVYRSSRDAELNLTNWDEQQKAAFALMQSMAQLAEYKTKFPDACLQVIIFNKRNAGRFYTCENDSEIRLIDITLLPQYRGRGIATALLNELIKRSDKIQKKITLHVAAGNPALNLYLRSGFIQTNKIGRYFYMERDPAFNHDSK